MRVPTSPRIVQAVALGFSLLAGVAAPALAGQGGLDLSFGVNGRVLASLPNGSVSGGAVAIQPDGKIVVVGTANLQNTSTSYDLAVARFNADGSLDTDFGTGGWVRVDVNGTNRQDFGNGVALQDDGKIVAVGGDGDFIAVRLTTAGALDSSFSGDGKVRTDVNGFDEAWDVKIATDGKVVVAGSANGFGVVRYLTDGTPDATFSGDGKTTVRFSSNGTDAGLALALQDDGAIDVAGSICPGGEPCVMGVERFLDDGSLDGTFGSGGLATISLTGSGDRARAIQDTPAGILLAGIAGNAGDFGIARLLSGGGPDAIFGTDGGTVTAFGADRYEEGLALIPMDDGTILVVGRSFGPGFSAPSAAIARYDSSGNLDPTFGAGGRILSSFGGSDEAYDAAVQGDKIVVVGVHDNAMLIARYHLGDNTPPGPVSGAQPVDETTGTTPVTITFTDVDSGGETTLQTSDVGPAIPDGFRLGNPPTYYEVETTAVFDTAEVCIHYTGVSYRFERTLRLYHYENGAWHDVTTSLDIDADIICGLVDSFSPFALVEETCPVKGDIAPNGGDEAVGLADVVFVRDVVRGDATADEGQVKCADVSPGSRTCNAPRSARAWCAEPDGLLDLGDVGVLFDLASGTGLGCNACVEAPDDRRLPGDITGDGIVDVADVIQALRFSLVLDVPEPEQLLRSDVVPGEHAEEVVVVTGDGAVTIGDIVLLLRAAVGLSDVRWPERAVGVLAGDYMSGRAWSVITKEWPAWAVPSRYIAIACSPDDAMFAETGDGWHAACLAIPEDVEQGSDLGVVVYRAPEAVTIDGVTTAAIVLDSSLVGEESAATLDTREVP